MNKKYAAPARDDSKQREHLGLPAAAHPVLSALCGLLLFMAFTIVSPFYGRADDLKLNQPAFKNHKSGLGDSAADSYAFTASSAFDILNDTASTDLYDPLTIQTLRRLKEDAQPAWEGDDEDVTKTRRVVERALAIQSGRNISSALERSELRSTYHALKQKVRTFQDNFRYSLQTNGETVAVSKDKRGKKLLELNVEINLKQGLDPQVKMGDNVRFRYDYTNQRPILEYGFRF